MRGYEPILGEDRTKDEVSQPGDRRRILAFLDLDLNAEELLKRTPSSEIGVVFDGLAANGEISQGSDDEQAGRILRIRASALTR